MPDLPLPIAPKPATEPVMARLFGAAIGTLGVAYYLPVFDRFEAVGRWRSSWNWAAALQTLNWLLFRQLWLAAAGYGVALLLFPLLVLGLGRRLFGLPLSVELGLWLSGVVLSVVLPGLWGNAMVYVDCQRRVRRALGESATLEQACALLDRRASTRKHAIGLGVANALLLGLALSAYVAWPEASTIGSNVSVRGSLPTAPPVAASRVLPASAAAVAVPTAPASTQATAVSKVLPASAAALAVQTAPASLVASAPASTVATRGRSASAASPASSVLVASVPVKVVASVAVSAATSLRTSTPALVASAARVVSAARAVVPVSVPNAPVRTASSASSSASVPVSDLVSGGVFVNVGLFAQAANARQVHARLVAVGIPVVSEQIKTPQGQQRTRVRVGPFANRVKAQEAVGQIKALQLDAVLTP